MKFALFDLFIVISFSVAAQRLLGRGRRPFPAPECRGDDVSSNRTCKTEQQLRHASRSDGAAAVGVGDLETHQETNAPAAMPGSDTPSSSEGKPEPRATAAQYPPYDDDEPSYPQVGNTIELYGDTSFFAIPAIVTGYDESSDKYSLHDAITNRRLAGVAPEFIHPYQVYGVGTEAFCNIGPPRKLEMSPCTVVSQSIKEVGFVSYQVNFTSEATDLTRDYLPFSRVQRVRRDRRLRMAT